MASPGAPEILLGEAPDWEVAVIVGLSGEVIPGRGSLERSVIAITKIVPSDPPEIKDFPSGERMMRETSP
jgi:hypothetical protein